MIVLRNRSADEMKHSNKSIKRKAGRKKKGKKKISAPHFFYQRPDDQFQMILNDMLYAGSRSPKIEKWAT